MTINRSKFFND